MRTQCARSACTVQEYCPGLIDHVGFTAESMSHFTLSEQGSILFWNNSPGRHCTYCSTAVTARGWLQLLPYRCRSLLNRP